MMEDDVFIKKISGHSFRRSSTTFFANTGASIEALKRHTGHKSSAVCETYIDESRGYKKRTANAIVSSLNSTSTSSTVVASNDLQSIQLEGSAPTSGLASVTKNCPVIPLVKGTGSDERAATSIGSYRNMAASTATSSVVRTQISHAIESMHGTVDQFDEISNFTAEAVKTEGMQSLSQQINGTQVSSQTFLSETEKRFAFYKCDNLTIHFGSTFQKK